MTRFTGALAAACLVLAVSLPPVSAQTPPAPETTPAPVLPPTQESPDAVPLSLADALRAALENNLDIRVQRVNPAVAEQQIQLATAPFDPAINADYTHLEAEEEPSALGQPATVKRDSASVTWSDRLMFGGVYEVGLAAERSDAPSSFSFYNPGYSSGITASFVLPLFRNFGTEVNRLDILIAESNLAVSQQELADRVNRTLQAVEDAYWNVAAAAKAREVALQSRGLAQELLELNRRKVEVGTLAPIEITQAEAGVAEREENVILAETARRDAEDQLRALMAIPQDDPRWSKPIAAVEPVQLNYEEVDVRQRIERALSTRPELEAARRGLQTAQLSELVAKKKTKPELNLVGSVNPTGNNLIDVTVLPGLDGIPNTVDDVIVPNTGGLGESLAEIPDFTNYTWTLGAQFRYSIHNRAAKAQLAIAGLDRERAELDIASLEQSISVEVRPAARGVVSGQERIAAARKNVELQERKLDAERKKFENGMSTSFEVLTFQNDLAAAQLSLIQAAIDYQRARVELERTTGTLLDARGMRFDPTTGR